MAEVYNMKCVHCRMGKAVEEWGKRGYAAEDVESFRADNPRDLTADDTLVLVLLMRGIGDLLADYIRDAHERQGEDISVLLNAFVAAFNERAAGVVAIPVHFQPDGVPAGETIN